LDTAINGNVFPAAHVMAESLTNFAFFFFDTCVIIFNSASSQLYNR
jgi:hypothetical protein